MGRSPSSLVQSSGYGASPAGGAGGVGPRSNSAIDPSAVRRASVRAQYAQRSRVMVNTNSPLVALRKWFLISVTIHAENVRTKQGVWSNV
jgi:hypothetical protein